MKWNSSHTNLTDKCLTTLHSSKLKSVTLVALDQLTNNGLITLAKNCPNICELMVPRCNQLTDGCFQAVTTLLKGVLVSVIYFNNWYLIEGDPTLYVKRGWLMIWAMWLTCDFKHPPVVIFWPTCVHLFFYEDKVKIGIWAGSIVDDNREFKIPRQRQPWKCCLKSEFAFLQSLIAIIRIHLLCQMQESYSEAEFRPIISKFRKRKKILSSFDHVRSVKRETRHFHHRSHAKTEKKCTKKHAACAELLFCLFNLVAS